jgi:hypothetical protein
LESRDIEELEANNPASAPSPEKRADEIADLRKELTNSDNAAMEFFYGRYKTSSVCKYVFAALDALRANAFEYVE